MLDRFSRNNVQAQGMLQQTPKQAPDYAAQGQADYNKMMEGVSGNNTAAGQYTQMPMDDTVSPNLTAAAYGNMTNSELAGRARANEAQMMSQADTTDPRLAMKRALAGINVDDPNITMDWVKGFELAQSRRESNTRLGMDQQKMGAALTDRFEGRAVFDGMQDAAKKGGLAGVIDYLTVTDPEKAMSFYKQKTELDASIMKNEVMSSMVPAEKAKALAEGYGVLGKMGTALLNANPGDRNNMYQTMLPMIKQINPSAPNVLNDAATGMFMLAQAQSTPENILYSSQKNNALYESKLGQLSSAIEQANKGGNFKLANDLQRQYDGVLAESQKSISQATSARLQAGRKEASMQPQNVLQENRNELSALRQQTKPFTTKLDTMTQAANVLSEIEANGGISNPKNALLANTLRLSTAKQVQSGVLTEPDYVRSGGTATWQEWQKKANEWAQGVQTPMNQDEFNQVKAMLKGAMKNNYDSIKQIEADHKLMTDPHTYADQDGQTKQIIDYNNFPLISRGYDKYFMPNQVAQDPNNLPIEQQAEMKIQQIQGMKLDPAAKQQAIGAIQARLLKMQAGQQ